MNSVMISLTFLFLLQLERFAAWYSFLSSQLFFCVGFFYFVKLTQFVFFFLAFWGVKDAELPPIMEEEEAAVEDLELSPNNEEMAIVLFKPVNAPFIQRSPSNLSFSVDSELISGFKKGKLTPQNPFPSFTSWVLAIFCFEL